MHARTHAPAGHARQIIGAAARQSEWALTRVNGDDVEYGRFEHRLTVHYSGPDGDDMTRAEHRCDGKTVRLTDPWEVRDLIRAHGRRCARPQTKVCVAGVHAGVVERTDDLQYAIDPFLAPPAATTFATEYEATRALIATLDHPHHGFVARRSAQLDALEAKGPVFADMFPELRAALTLAAQILDGGL